MRVKLRGIPLLFYRSRKVDILMFSFYDVHRTLKYTIAQFYANNYGYNLP